MRGEQREHDTVVNLRRADQRTDARNHSACAPNLNEIMIKSK